MGEAMHVCGQRIHGKYLYLPLSFAVKASLKKLLSLGSFLVSQWWLRLCSPGRRPGFDPSSGE